MNDPPTRQRTRAGFAWAGVALLALISLRFLRPTILSNEAVYLLRGRRIVEPTFLANDWAVGAEAWYQSMSVAFDVLAGALWASLGDAIPVVLVGRLFAWTLAVASLARLASTAGVHPGFFLAGAAAWLVGGQAFSAGESIFGAVEQKVFAYAALFAALDAACRGRVLRAGVFAGVAIAFHVLVGGWGGAALGIGVLVRYRSLREGLRFGLPALLLGAPVMFIAMSSLVAASPEAPVRYQESGCVCSWTNAVSFTRHQFSSGSNSVISRAIASVRVPRSRSHTKPSWLTMNVMMPEFP